MRHTIATILTAGAFATLAFDIFGQALSPLFGYAKLAPVGLAGATLKTVFGANPPGAAHFLHAITGLVFYVVGYVAIARPIQRAVLPQLHWSVTAAGLSMHWTILVRKAGSNSKSPDWCMAIENSIHFLTW